ncbi:Putative zinc-or iron-chelating domain-containing protein [Mariniphaga anaerophila]|uniref:Putative zinc-or iron-chelating domain-containing protein n=1 Tax=Mariniphaga anaerophila TaxID=1484053 RepID=A0A1M4W5Y6_9BACT|nr:YkgJ family cysteine cluster protein [Mariniphaga anaerophila]SHE76513.1 Putative zinc-or iron-chelating domain-containing protein [Mariniphaga anaerophila]
MEKHFIAYRQLRKEIDNASDKLLKEHAGNMQCKKGCDLCCMDYSILPLEFYSILDELKTRNLNTEELPEEENMEEGDCVFLKNHVCAIYESRPMICRTHGLPLLYTNDDDEWELSTCELNFTQFDFEKFTPENTYPQDKFNSELFLLNRKFVAEFKEEIHFGEFDLLPLKKLKSKL